MSESLNPNRVKLARERRGLTLKALSELTGLTTRTLSSYEASAESSTSHESVCKLSKALGFPVDFFYGDDIDELDVGSVSFRALSKMKASEKNSALGAGRIAVAFNTWLDSNFTLPRQNLLDLRGQSPQAAAEAIRQYWGLGELSVRNVIHLLEKNGVRVFSLAEQNCSVDAYSFWKDGTPFVFLNSMKSAERSRFDAAHELGHLLMHNHGTPSGREVEREADAFASAFLMPEGSVRARAIPSPSVADMVALKKNWNVSVAALIRRFYDLGIISDWQYRGLSIELSRLGYFKKEPQSIMREKSQLLPKVVAAMKANGQTVESVAKQLCLPKDELDILLFTTRIVSRNDTPVNIQTRQEKPALRLVK